MSTLNVVEQVLRERGTPMVVREIVEAAGDHLPTQSKTPDTVVARDLAMDIKRNGETSRFTRTSPGRYALRELQPACQAEPEPRPEPQAAGSEAAEPQVQLPPTPPLPATAEVAPAVPQSVPSVPPPPTQPTLD